MVRGGRVDGVEYARAGQRGRGAGWRRVCRWPRPPGCWRSGSGCRCGRHAGMSSRPLAAGVVEVPEASVVFTVKLPAVAGGAGA